MNKYRIIAKDEEPDVADVEFIDTIINAESVPEAVRKFESMTHTSIIKIEDVTAADESQKVKKAIKLLRAKIEANDQYNFNRMFTKFE